MNILVTAIGSMSALPVIEALQKMRNVTIVGTDIHPAESLYEAGLVDQFYQIPKSVDAGYVKTLTEIIKKNEIQYIIPLIDFEVDVLNQHRHEFESLNSMLTIPHEKAVRICRDKWELHQHFKNSGKIRVIPLIGENEIGRHQTFPVIAKLKNGRSSEGLKILWSPDEINTIDNPNSYIFQPSINGSVYTVDLVRDRFGNQVSIARKELKRTANGAGLSVIIENNGTLTSLSEMIAEDLDILGCINIEFIYDGSFFYLMDINPRFSAGISFSHLAGYDMVTNHLRCFLGEPIEKLKSLNQQTFFKIFKDFSADYA